MRRNVVADLQRRNGDQQECRAGRARLADHFRLQHVSVSDFKMGRRNFVRAYASIDGFAGRISHDHPRRVALAARRPAMGPQPGRHRGCRCDSARNSGRSSSHDDERSNRHLSRLCRAGISRTTCFHRSRDHETLVVDRKPAF